VQCGRLWCANRLQLLQREHFSYVHLGFNASESLCQSHCQCNASGASLALSMVVGEAETKPCSRARTGMLHLALH
jgi:hypothetical protein